MAISLNCLAEVSFRFLLSEDIEMVSVVYWIVGEMLNNCSGFLLVD